MGESFAMPDAPGDTAIGGFRDDAAAPYPAATGFDFAAVTGAVSGTVVPAQGGGGADGTPAQALADFQALLSRSVQLTAEACAAWTAGDWNRGALLICQAADLETAALRSAGAVRPAPGRRPTGGPRGHAA
jgi:hypothetical protein